MTSISYDDVFEFFLGYINDYNIISMSKNDAYEIFTEFLHKTVAKPYVRKLFVSISLNDNRETINYQLKIQSDNDFVVDLLAKGMVIEWLQKQIKSPDHLHQFFGGKEQKWFSQATHLAELRGLLKDAKSEFRRLINSYTYINNSYLGETSET